MEQDLIKKLMIYIYVGMLAIPFIIGSIGPKRIFSLFHKDLEPPRLELRITEEEEESKNYSPDKYAVFISGSGAWYRGGRRNWNSIVFAYSTLLEKDFKKENMYVLFYDGKNKDGLDIVDAPAKKPYLEMLFKYLGEKIGPEDKLLIGVVGHGHRIKDESVIALEKKISEYDSMWEMNVARYNHNLTESQFEAMVNQIHPEYAVLIFNQCHSGGFAELGKGRFIALTSSDATRETYKCIFFDSFFKELGGGVSIGEAFNYAKKILSNHPYADARHQNPLLRTELDASEINLK